MWEMVFSAITGDASSKALTNASSDVNIQVTEAVSNHYVNGSTEWSPVDVVP